MLHVIGFWGSSICYLFYLFFILFWSCPYKGELKILGLELWKISYIGLISLWVGGLGVAFCLVAHYLIMGSLKAFLKSPLYRFLMSLLDLWGLCLLQGLKDSDSLTSSLRGS